MLLTFLLLLLVVVGLWTLFVHLWETKTKQDPKGKHVLITGASRGLGLEISRQFAGKGAKVSLVARDLPGLNAAKEQILKEITTATVQVVRGDVKDEKGIKETVAEAIKEFGPIDTLICCAGAAYTGYFLELPTQTFKDNMELNYYGTLHTVKAVVPGMVERKKGHIVIVSSGLALTSYIGYTAYCPTKHAIRGLAGALRSELQRYNIQVSNAYPPGMKTPGYEVEQKTKPEETKNIESLETIYKPELCGAAVVDSILKGEDEIACGDFGINLLIRSSTGIGPRRNFMADMLVLPLGVVVGVIYRSIWNRFATSGPGRSSS